MTEPSPLPPEAWSRALASDFHGWRVLDATSLALDLPANCACNMEGAIAVARAMLPPVLSIEVIAGGVTRVFYQRPSTRSKDWRAIPPHVARPAPGGRPNYPPTLRGTRTNPLRQP
jgi:hypothetical protein